MVTNDGIAINEDIYFSALLYNAYSLKCKNGNDPFTCARRFAGIDYFPFNYKKGRTDSSRILLLENVATEKNYFARGITQFDNNFKRYARMIYNPVEPTLCLWPADIVKLHKSHSTDITRSVAHKYDENPDEIGFDGALLFPYDTKLGNLKSVYSKLSECESISYKNSIIQKLSLSIVKSLIALNKQKYICLDMHLSRIYQRLKDDNDCFVYFDFSNLIYPFEYSPKLQRTDYPLEFAHPFCFSKETAIFDNDVQNYNLAAMLFYLFFGRYAYDVGALDTRSDGLLDLHYIRLRTNLLTHEFVISRANTSSILCRELWDEIPDAIKELFESALILEKSQRPPSPEDWLNAFKSSGWFEFKDLV